MTRDERRMAAKCIGGLALGVAISAWAAAPPGRYTIDAGTLLDTKTMLTWQRNTPAQLYNWADAVNHCPTLGPGWRLPTIKELQSLVDVRVSNPSIDDAGFPNTPSGGFWSSSPFVSNPAEAWILYFNYGYTNTNNVLDTRHVRCVQ